MFNLNLTKRGFINKKSLLRRLGHIENRQKIAKSLNNLIDAVIELSEILIQPKQVVNISRIRSITDRSVEIENGFLIESTKVASLMAGCEQIISFIVTIGPKLEQKRDHFIVQKETSQALLLDACGSEAAEALAESLNISLIRDYSKKGFELTKRYSPGYGDWCVSSQKDLLAFLNAGQIGVKLTETFIMSPEKSVSAVIGLKKI